MVKKIVAKIIFIAGVLLLADGLLLAVKTNVNTGTILVLMAGAALAAYGIWYKKIERITAKGFPRIVKYAVLAVLLLLICLIGFLACQGHSDSVAYKEDAVIVLGAAVHGDQVSRSLAHRLDKAVEYSEKNPGALIVVSGGKGAQETITEAAAMEAYLVDKGIPQDKIVKEEKATSTYENFKFSRELLDGRFQERAYTCVYITNYFHVYRAGNMAKLTGIEAAGLGADTDWYYLPSAYLRESLAVVKLWVLGN
ncbi:YdcF family protein [Anaerovorax odorimutans]|uniref:YdcF family protein n=1 Tax=Anaerovorax odorimutans TaxID=109327 RepID=A0ABT1RKK4_9FIRM|nr:YdcF family protein [Anaerovorax odorimutans]MCQ4635719.1 YdcF family protein [Anaerovorax odorimutans]